MKIILLPAVIFIFLVMFLSSLWLLLNDNTYVIGGTYVVRDGEVVKGDLNLIFAQVELERGAQVDGRVLSVSSALDLNGAVAGDILAIGSDIHVGKRAELKTKPREIDAFPYVILLPQMGRIGTQ